MFFNEEFETLPRPALEALQLKLLQSTLERVYANVPFYKASFDAAGIKPSIVSSLKDLQKLPFTTKQDMRDSYPYALFAAPMDEIVRIHASSGTTGKPTVVGYTKKDISTWSELMARSFVAAGAHKGDIIHNAYGYGLFTGGLGAHYGAELLGASVIPISGGNTKRQIMIMQDFGSTVLTCTPSYSLFMAEEAEGEGIDFKKLKLRVGIFGAEPWSEEMRTEIEAKLNLSAIDIYGLSEIMGPGVAIECIEAKRGLHIWEDHFIPEIINPDTGETLPEGERGELVITTITKQGIPLIRYRTRDITSLTYEPCICGRTHARITRMSGRSDDMLIIRGVNVFPSQIEAVLVGIEGIEPHYMLIVDRQGTLDTLTVQVEVSEQLFSDEIKVLQALSRRVEKEIKDMLGVTCTAKLVEPKTIQRSEGKAKRVIDNRKLLRALLAAPDFWRYTMKVEQISIFIENKSGRLAEITRILGEADINIRALSLADTSDFGILRLIVNDCTKANTVLKEAGFTVSRTEVVAVEVPDRPGGLSAILQTLDREAINVEYMYAFVERCGGNAVIIFRFDESDKAIAALKGHNFNILEGSRLYTM